MTTTFSLATPVSGNLEIHVDGCSHMKRLWGGGGGILADRLSFEEAQEQAESEVGRPAKVAECTKQALRTAKQA